MRSVPVMILAVAMLVGSNWSNSFTYNVIDLSSRNLSSVPSNLPQNVENLDLSLNHIRLIHQGDFKNTPNLRTLNLSWNGLEEIELETFKVTPLLDDLDLSHNGLRNLSNQTYLRYTKNLRILNLSFNKILTMTLGDEFSSLVRLERLVLGANKISIGDFKKMSGIKLIRLSIYQENGFAYEESSLRDVQAARLQLAFTKTQKADHGLITDALLLFNEVELMGLTQDYNSLTDHLNKQRGIITSHLCLTNIQITWRSLTDFVIAVIYSSITHLTISDVAISQLPQHDTDWTRPSNMSSFTVRSAVVKSFFFSQEAVYNFFINMPVNNVAILDTSIIHMTCPKSQSYIKQMDFSNCALSDTIFSDMETEKILECKHLANLNKLILSSNNLKSLQILSSRVQYMSSLRDLDLSLNSLTYNSIAKCVWPANIIHMNLSSNGLTHSVFECLPNRIKVLDLSNNQISVLSTSLLKLDFLLSLDLSNNRLRELPACDGFPSLNVLLLRANSLHAPSVTHLESCPKLKILDISNNPFTCTCALRSFRNIGIKSESRNAGVRLLRWPSAYTCSYPEAFKNSTLKDFWIPEVSCNVGLLAATILGPAVVLILAMVTLCYRWDVPWYIGMIWQWTRAKHRARTQHVRPEDLVGVEFHAFISYSQHDAEWVKNSLLPHLEGPAGELRICHHERNFLPGKSIIENIMRCVEKSRHCVFVLSAHFVKSEWCHYELYFASHQRLSRGSESVVLVLLEPLPQYLIPSKYHQLKNMMSRHTYLEWPQDKAKHRLFWANLRAALQADLPNVPVGQPGQ